METLELEPLEEKNLRVILVEKEYEEPWDIDYLKPREEDRFRSPSEKFLETLRDLIDEHQPDFATDEQGNRSEEEFGTGRLAELFDNEGIRLESVEMDDYALPYLANRLDDILEKKEDLRKAYDTFYEKNPDEATRGKLDKILSYGQHLQQQYEEELDRISYPVRQRWIAMGIMETAKEIESDEVTALHLCSPSYMNGMEALLESLEVEVTQINIEKSVQVPDESMEAGDIVKQAESIDVQLEPQIADGDEKRKDLLFFFDTDERASPFDICQATDAGFDLVIPYHNVSPDSVDELVQDAVFSRGVEGVSHTSFFLGGSDYQKVRELSDAVEDAMVGPFQASVVTDPVGANTTGSAMIAKVSEGLSKIGEGTLEGKKVTVLAGTGPVGRVGAMLCASEGSDVTITSRKEDRAKKIAEELSEECGHEIKGVKASNDEEILEATEDSDIILATGPEGVRIVSEDILKKLDKRPIVMADVNAVPPSGIEGLDSDGDMQEIMDGIYGIGPLATGNIKNEVEGDLLTQARKADQGRFDQWEAYELAKDKVALKPTPKV